MKESIKAWISRIVVLAVLGFCIKAWGVPLYKQYFTHEPEQAFIPTTKVQDGPFTVSFHEMGTLEAEKSETVTCQVNDGRIIWIAKDGDIVKKGAKLVELDVERMRMELTSAKTQYESAVSGIGRAEEGLKMYEKQRQNELAKAKEDYAFAEEQVKLSKDQLEKKRELAKDKLIPSDQIIQAEMESKNQEMDLKKRKMDLELLDEQVKSDVKLKAREIEEAHMTVERTKGELERIKKQISQAVINAPGDGLVVLSETWDSSGRRKIRVGDQVYNNHSIATLPDLNHMMVRVKIGESDAPKAQIGIKTLVRLDSVPNRIFHGTVKTIDSLAKPDDRFGFGGGQKKIDVMISLDEADPRLLKPGMTADVEFINTAVDKAVYVPLESVFEKNGKTIVYLKKNKTYQAVPVKTGLSNDICVCVKKGLKKGQTIALRDPSRPLDEQGVKTTEPSQEKKKKAAPVPVPGAKK